MGPGGTNRQARFAVQVAPGLDCSGRSILGFEKKSFRSLVWSSSSLTVTRLSMLKLGSSAATCSSTLSLPSPISCRTTAAVNVFEIDARAKPVSGVTAVPAATFA